MTTTNVRPFRIAVVCPCYRLPQLVDEARPPDSSHRYGIPQLLEERRTEETGRRPRCAALNDAWRIDPQHASRFCRSSQYGHCPRFVTTVPRPVTPSVAKRLLASVLWVLGIPTAIVIVILLAAWLTEHVFVAAYVPALLDLGDVWSR
jgi:hypothetical protein